MTSAFGIQIDRVRRRWWLVLAVAVLAVLAAFVSSSGATTYSTKAALAVGSQARAPEQDAVLTQGYVDFFNDPSYQSNLRAKAAVPGDVTFEARTAASSPILYVIAKSSDRDGVAAAATKMASAFRDQINDGVRASHQQAIAAIERPFDEIRAANGVIPELALTQMQDRVSAINGDTTSMLQDVQLDSAIQTSSPARSSALGVALLGGLVLGCIVALAVGVATRRLGTDYDIAEKTELEPLAVIPAPTDPRREQRLRQLSNIFALSSRPGSGVVAVTSAHPTDGAALVATAIARHRAGHGVGTVLIDMGAKDLGGHAGLGEYLSGTTEASIADLAKPGSNPNLRTIAWGVSADGYAAVTRERIEVLIAELRVEAELIVFAAPPVLDAAEAEVVCAVAGQTVVVIEQGVSRSNDVVEARRLLEQVDATIVGAVLVDTGARPDHFERLRGSLRRPDVARHRDDISPGAESAGDLDTGEPVAARE